MWPSITNVSMTFSNKISFDLIENKRKQEVFIFISGKRLKCHNRFQKSEKVYFHVLDTGTQVLDNTRPFWHSSISSIICFWMPPACSKECKYKIFRQYWYTRYVPVFTNTGAFQYLGPEAYFFPKIFCFHLFLINSVIHCSINVSDFTGGLWWTITLLSTSSGSWQKKKKTTTEMNNFIFSYFGEGIS